MEPITWADGFGRWHARVSKHAAGPLIAARRAIRDELQARQNAEVPRHFYMCLEHKSDLDTDETVVYAEPATEADTCTRCQREIRFYGYLQRDADDSLYEVTNGGTPVPEETVAHYASIFPETIYFADDQEH